MGQLLKLKTGQNNYLPEQKKGSITLSDYVQSSAINKFLDPR